MLDHTTFEICERELANVSMALEKVLLAFDSKKDARDELEELLARIKELEIIFEKAVRVAIKEPMLFLIFIQQLYALHQHLSEHKI